MQTAVQGRYFTEVDGHPAIGTGLTALLLFRDGSTVERRRAVAEIARDYLALVGDRIRWRSTEDETIDLQRNSAPAIEKSKGFTSPKTQWWYSYGAGDSVTDASAYLLTFLCQASWDPKGVSYLYLQLPLMYMNAEFILRFQKYASDLSADQAYGGVGVMQRPGTAYAHAAAYLVYMLATQHPGLQVFSPSNTWETYNLTDSLASVNWLTAVSDRYLARLGGWEIAARGLDPRIAIYKYHGGVIFQAGAKPDLGDATKGLRPELYCQVARALKPLRFSGKQGGFYRPSDKGPTLDAGNTAIWLDRFD